MQIIIVFVIFIIVIILFSIEKISVDIIIIAMLICLMATGILTPAEAFSGYGTDFIMILASIFVISGALQQTGILDLIGSRFQKVGQTKPGFLLTYIMATVGMTSAFMNNITVTAMFIAPVTSVARIMKINSSRLLMPVAYASILGGTCTLIGTSTNIAVSGYITQNGMKPLGMFEMLPVGIIFFIVGLIYMITIGKKMLPDKKDEALEIEFNFRDYISEMVITSDSKLIGQNIFKSSLNKSGFRILNIIRNNINFLPDSTSILLGGDIIIIEGNVEDLLKIKETAGMEIRADLLSEKSMQNENIKLAEILVTPQSDFLNRTLKEANFNQRFGLVVVAINRYGQTIKEKLGRIILKVGDILLVQGNDDRINFLKTNRQICMMADFKPLVYKKRKGRLTLLFFILGIIAGSFNVLPLSAALMSSALLTILIKAISIEKAYQAIDWRMLIMLGGMAALGLALKNTGGAEWLANNIVHVFSPFGVIFVLAGFILLTVLLTQPMSNAAAALLVLPIALETAHQLNVNPRTFAIAVMLSASISLITPFEPSCLLVYGPGKYKFMDFLKTGSLLTIILMLIMLWLIPYFWPF